MSDNEKDAEKGRALTRGDFEDVLTAYRGGWFSDDRRREILAHDAVLRAEVEMWKGRALAPCKCGAYELPEHNPQCPVGAVERLIVLGSVEKARADKAEADVERLKKERDGLQEGVFVEEARADTAESTLLGAGWVRVPGPAGWKPPLGNPPAFLLAEAEARVAVLEKALRRFFTEGHGLGASHPHFAGYVHHDKSVWEEATAALSPEGKEGR